MNESVSLDLGRDRAGAEATGDLLAPLRDWALAARQRPALRAAGRADSSFAELLATVEQAADTLRRCGVGPASRVATILPNAPETAVAILAVASIAAVVPVNPATPPQEMARILTDAAVTHVIAGSDGDVGAAARLGLPVLRLEADRRRTGAFALRGADMPAGNAAEARDPARIALVLHTSGSTGAPKRVPLSVANLSASARNIARSLELGPNDVCLAMMPMFHIGALVDLLLAPLSAGGSVAFAGAISTDAFFEAVALHRPTWFQAVPTVLRDILARAGERSTGLGSLRLIRAVSQPLPEKLHAELEAALGVPIVPMFGMTETAGLIASAPLDPRLHRPGSVGRPCGPQVRIADAFGNEVEPGRRGEVLVRGDNVMAGYEGNAARADSFRGEWLRTGDEGHFDRDGFLFLTGRLKDVINRGGEKVSPLEIDLLLAGHPAIAEAAAFPLPHPTLGEEVAAAIVLKQGAALDEREAIAFLRPHLAEHKLPRRVIFLDRLPRVASGKLDRLALPALAGAIKAERTRTPPSTPLAKTLAAMWQKTLGVAEVAMEDDFFELGGDSLSALNFTQMLEQRFGRDLPVNLLFDAPTLVEMEATIARDMRPEAGPTDLEARIHAAVRRVTASWRGRRRREDSLVVGRNTMGAKRPFFWVSQTLHGFDQISGAFDPDRPLYVMCSLSPTRLKSDANTRLLARRYAQEIDELQPDGPLLVGGFCQGGVVAFWIARHLQAQGREVGLLCLQDRFVAEPYDGEVSFFTGKRGGYCQYYSSVEPERGWSKYYSGHISVLGSSADHCELHEPGHVEEFVAQLESEFARVEAGLPPLENHARPPLTPLDKAARKAAVSFSAPLLMRQGSSRTIRVKARNTSPLAWEPTNRSGLILASRWQTFNRVHPYLLDGRAVLDRAVPAGGNVEFALDIQVPMVGLPMLLEMDMVEDGICWFSQDRGRPTRRLVIPLPPD